MTIGKLLGIDHGDARIGVAVCDGLRMVARELTIVERESDAVDFARLNKIAGEENVVGIVIGLPVDHDAPPDDDRETQAQRVQAWAATFAETTRLPIRFYDEQLSSEDAKIIARRKKRHVRAHIDDLAARVILQRYLDAVRDGLAESL